MPINPMSRMAMSGSQGTPAQSEMPKTEEEKTAEMLDKTEKQVDAAESVANELKQGIPEEELISDIDLENFYITGEIAYEYKLNDKLLIRFRMLDSNGLLELNDFLYSCYRADKSAKSVLLEHSMRTLAKALMRYGTTDLSKLSEDKRLEFIKSIPSMVLPQLARKYAVFEASVEKKLNGDSIKN